MKKPKLILCDIDGTLVTDEKIFTDKTREVINKLHSQGIWFGIASGRPLDEIKYDHYRLDFKPEIIIGNNGADLYDGIHDKAYYDLLLKREWMKEIIELMQRFKDDCNYFVNDNGRVLLKRMDPVMEKSLARTAKEFIIVKDDSEMYENENAKVLFRFFDIAKADRCIEYLKTQKFEHYKGFKTQPAMVEFSHIEASKAYSLNKFCKINDLSLDDVVACGDLTNDNEMLEAAGLSICMCNGGPDTKAICDIITKEDNNNSGLAKCLEELNNNDWRLDD